MKTSLINQLKTSKVFLDKSTEALTEEDSGITPVEGMMTAAQQMAHIAQTVDWFIDGDTSVKFPIRFTRASLFNSRSESES